jgi:hypothetical protein
MQAEIKPIETHYKGYRFRSRLEARWAVFFDALQIRWDYESEGFELGAVKYLPDFFLPELRMFVEVKRDKANSNEIQKAKQLMLALGYPVLVTQGMPDGYCTLVYRPVSLGHWAVWSEQQRAPYTNNIRVESGSCCWWLSSLYFTIHDLQCDRQKLEFTGYDALHILRHNERLVALNSKNTDALFTARGARFEFGETGV